MYFHKEYILNTYSEKTLPSKTLNKNGFMISFVNCFDINANI